MPRRNDDDPAVATVDIVDPAAGSEAALVSVVPTSDLAYITPSVEYLEDFSFYTDAQFHPVELPYTVAEITTTGIYGRLQSRLVDLVELYGIDIVGDFQSDTEAFTDLTDPGERKRLIDLHYIVDRLLEIQTPENAYDWLHSYNPDLGAVPAEIMRRRGTSQIIDVINALDADSYL